MQNMKKWKYYSKLDENQETIGIVEAMYENTAYILACHNKKLSMVNFKKLFKIKKIK